MFSGRQFISLEREEGLVTMDFYATDSDLLKQVNQLERNAKKFKAKREEAQEYCEKFSEHIQLMRKDLLSLESNEDAVTLHDELKGITDVNFFYFS